MLYPLTLILSPKYRDWNFSHSVRPNYISVEWGVVQGSHASDWLKSITWPLSKRAMQLIGSNQSYDLSRLDRGSHAADWFKSIWIMWPLSAPGARQLIRLNQSCNLFQFDQEVIHAADWMKSIPWPISARPGSHTADWIKSITWPLPIRPESHACCWLDEINHVTSSGWTYLNMYTVYSAYSVQCTVSTDSRSFVVWSMLPFPPTFTVFSNIFRPANRRRRWRQLTHYQSWARDNTAATTWPCFRTKKLLIIA